MNEELLICWTKGWQEGETYNITRDEWTCEASYEFCDCPTNLEADPDIAGIGVIISFVACTTISLILTIGLRFSAFYHPRGWITPPNPLDKMIIGLAVDILPKNALKRQALKTANICYDMVVCLSDQQLATGIGVLIAGLKKLYDGTISTYHFRIVMHLASITASGYRFSIVAYFTWRQIKEQTPNLTSSRRQLFRGKFARMLRVLLVVTLDVLFLYCAWATADDIWRNGSHCPAKCVLNSPRRLTNITRPLVDTAFTLVSYISGGIALNNLFRGKRVRRQRKGLDYYFSGVFSSGIFMVAIHVLWYGYDLWSIMYDLKRGHALMLERGQQEDAEAEYSMSFGQIVPVFLLILPILQLLESLSAHSEINRDKDKPDKSNPRQSTSGCARITTW